jgi:hypothetical protein
MAIVAGPWGKDSAQDIVAATKAALVLKSLTIAKDRRRSHLGRLHPQP